MITWIAVMRAIVFDKFGGLDSLLVVFPGFPGILCAIPYVGSEARAQIIDKGGKDIAEITGFCTEFGIQRRFMPIKTTPTIPICTIAAFLFQPLASLHHFLA
jgi:hypothetical protein